jgi:hypothetical protein
MDVVYKWKRYGVLWTVTEYKNEITSNIYFFNNFIKIDPLKLDKSLIMTILVKNNINPLI